MLTNLIVVIIFAICVYHIITLFTFNLHNIMCSYISIKPEKKNHLLNIHEFCEALLKLWKPKSSPGVNTMKIGGGVQIEQERIKWSSEHRRLIRIWVENKKERSVIYVEIRKYHLLISL